MHARQPSQWREELGLKEGPVTLSARLLDPDDGPRPEVKLGH